MKQKSLNALPTFSELNTVLRQTVLKLHASQAHGLICGVLAGSPIQLIAWEEVIAGENITGKTHQVLQTLYENSRQQLHDFNFDFQLLLPKESQSLPLRAEALTLWCQGFLTGLKLAHVQVTDREPSEMTEAINDLIEIAKMNYEEVVASEEDEQAYVELVEYVRTATVLIYEAQRESQDSSNTKDRVKHLH